MKKIMVLLSIFALVMLVACIPQDTKTLTSTGTATLTVDPDEAYVVVAVETLAESADVSKNENAAITDAIYAALFKINIKRDNIETQNFNIYEEFDWTQEGRVSKGFKTAHNIKITTENFDDIGDIVDATVDAGATRIEQINFVLSTARQNELKKEALKQASRDAREKAEAIAAGLDAKVGGIVSVNNADYNYPDYRYLETAVMAADSAKFEETVISPRSLDVTARVEVVFEIR